MKTSNLLNIVLAAALLVVCVRMAVAADSDNSRRAAGQSADTEVMAADSPEARSAHPDGTFKELPVNEYPALNPFTYFRGKGLLLAAGNREKSNAMTIGWGAMGTLWSRSTVTVYVAEKRYTKEFMDRSPYFTVMAFAEGDSILRYMGHHSGRDGDKAAALGLHTLYTDNGTPYYAEADIVLECRLLYAAPLDSAAFKDDVPREHYAKRGKAGLHTMYIGEVVRALRKE